MSGGRKRDKKDWPPRYMVQTLAHTLKTGEVLLIVKHREFIYVGEPVPELDAREHAAFLMNFQRAVLLSLEKRNLLTASQRERCLRELEKQYSINGRSCSYVNR